MKPRTSEPRACPAHVWSSAKDAVEGMLEPKSVMVWVLSGWGSDLISAKLFCGCTHVRVATLSCITCHCVRFYNQHVCRHALCGLPRWLITLHAILKATWLTRFRFAAHEPVLLRHVGRLQRRDARRQRRLPSLVLRLRRLQPLTGTLPSGSDPAVIIVITSPGIVHLVIVLLLVFEILFA